jgi:forkhead-containing protein
MSPSITKIMMAMGDRSDYLRPSFQNCPLNCINTSKELCDRFMQPLELSLSPTTSRIVHEPALNYDPFSAANTWITSGFIPQLSESMSSRLFDSSIPWRSGVSSECMSISTQKHTVFATDGDYLSFNSDCLTNPQSPGESVLSLSGLPHSDSLNDKLSRLRTEAFPISTNSLINGQCLFLPLQSKICPSERLISCADDSSIRPSSLALSISSNVSRKMDDAVNVLAPIHDPMAVPEDIEIPSRGIGDGESSEQPYSRLIYQALASAPGMKLPLQEIYCWFEKNTAKGKDPNSKGWQNSVRHNLSMNAVGFWTATSTGVTNSSLQGFEAVKEESPANKKIINFWRLTEDARKHGIQSTTRYRKHGNHKKSIRPEHPAPQRQRSGAKGGRAAKIAARFRRTNGHERKRGRPPHRNGYNWRQDKDGNISPRASTSYIHVLTPETTVASPLII